MSDVEEFGCVWQENVPIDEVLEHLKCTTDGLSSEDVEKRLQMFGHNKLEEKKVLQNHFFLFSFSYWSDEVSKIMLFMIPWILMFLEINFVV